MPALQITQLSIVFEEDTVSIPFEKKSISDLVKQLAAAAYEKKIECDDECAFLEKHLVPKLANFTKKAKDAGSLGQFLQKDEEVIIRRKVESVGSARASSVYEFLNFNGNIKIEKKESKSKKRTSFELSVGFGDRNCMISMKQYLADLTNQERYQSFLDAKKFPITDSLKKLGKKFEEVKKLTKNLGEKSSKVPFTQKQKELAFQMFQDHKKMLENFLSENGLEEKPKSTKTQKRKQVESSSSDSSSSESESENEEKKAATFFQNTEEDSSLQQRIQKKFSKSREVQSMEELQDDQTLDLNSQINN